ncbi:hypothetical protein K438DRAFT_1953223 [Mycena galopus ATCC 62051]|nr:hypothetical protein K438DRAFT_1953223 [Mycena galopus ATCC 62051]
MTITYFEHKYYGAKHLLIEKSFYITPAEEPVVALAEEPVEEPVVAPAEEPAEELGSTGEPRTKEVSVKVEEEDPLVPGGKKIVVKTKIVVQREISKTEVGGSHGKPIEIDLSDDEPAPTAGPSGTRREVSLPDVVVEEPKDGESAEGSGTDGPAEEE